MIAAFQKAKGPAETAISPSHGSSNPDKGKPMNTHIPTPPAHPVTSAAAISRRTLLAGLATVSATGTAGSAFALASTDADSEAASLPAVERIERAFDEIRAAAKELWPDIDWWRTHIGTEGDQHEGVPILLMATRRAEPRYEVWSGPGRYELDIAGKRPIYWVERIEDWHGPCYRGCHWWNGKRAGPWTFFAKEDLKIIRKMMTAGSTS